MYEVLNGQSGPVYYTFYCDTGLVQRINQGGTVDPQNMIALPGDLNTNATGLQWTRWMQPVVFTQTL